MVVYCNVLARMTYLLFDLIQSMSLVIELDRVKDFSLTSSSSGILLILCKSRLCTFIILLNSDYFVVAMISYFLDLGYKLLILHWKESSFSYVLITCISKLEYNNWNIKFYRVQFGQLNERLDIFYYKILLRVFFFFFPTANLNSH